MNLECVQFKEDNERESELAERRAVLMRAYNALPAYGSAAFWRTLEEGDTRATLPLEVLVRCVRDAAARRDDEGRRRILEIIFRRLHTTNEYWANNVLKATHLQADERNALVYDLYADLCECVMRAIMDTKRSFWEENFRHCLSFERSHVYRTFMRREGRWQEQDGKRSDRIPRTLVESLDQPLRLADGEAFELNVEDKLAQKALLAVEQTDIPRIVLRLPDRLKAVVLLIFWEGRTEKDAAGILGITDRTVRNRLRDALKILHGQLEPEREYANG